MEDGRRVRQRMCLTIVIFLACDFFSLLDLRIFFEYARVCVSYFIEERGKESQPPVMLQGVKRYNIKNAYNAMLHLQCTKWDILATRPPRQQLKQTIHFALQLARLLPSSFLNDDSPDHGLQRRRSTVENNRVPVLPKLPKHECEESPQLLWLAHVCCSRNAPTLEGVLGHG